MYIDFFFRNVGNGGRRNLPHKKLDRILIKAHGLKSLWRYRPEILLSKLVAKASSLRKYGNKEKRFSSLFSIFSKAFMVHRKLLPKLCLQL